MSTKPSTTPRWAATSPGTITGAVTVPTSGKKNLGFVPGERGAAQYVNWFMELAYEWCQYLSDGALSGAVTMDSTLAVTTGYYGPGLTAALFPAGLSSVGALTGASLHFTTATPMIIPTLMSADNAGAGGATTHTRGYGSWILAASATAIYYPILLPNGSRITAYVVGVNKNDTNNAVLTKLIHADNTGDHDDSAGAASPIIAGNWATGESSLAVDVAGSQYYIRITPGGTITPAADRIFAVYVSFTRP